MGAGIDPGSDSGVAGGRDHRVVREGNVSPPLNPGRRPGYRNGYGKPRRLTLSSGTIQ